MPLENSFILSHTQLKGSSASMVGLSDEDKGPDAQQNSVTYELVLLHVSTEVNIFFTLLKEEIKWKKKGKKKALDILIFFKKKM